MLFAPIRVDVGRYVGGGENRRVLAFEIGLLHEIGLESGGPWNCFIFLFCPRHSVCDWLRRLILGCRTCSCVLEIDFGWEVLELLNQVFPLSVVFGLLRDFNLVIVVRILHGGTVRVRNPLGYHDSPSDPIIA